MKLLLTSGGVTNTSIREVLVDLLGKSIDESSALCIPTAEYGHPWCTPASAWRFIAGQSELGWKSVGVLELTALMHRRGALGALGPGGRRSVRRRRRRRLPLSLDAPERAGGPPGHTARDGLGRGKCREHGYDAPDR